MKSPATLTARPVICSLALGASAMPAAWAQTSDGLASDPVVVPVGDPITDAADYGIVESDAKSAAVVAPKGAGSDFASLFSAAVRGSMRFDDNLFLTDSNEEEDTVIAVTPTLQLANDEDSQNTWAIAYAPSIISYLDNSDLNSINHALDFKLGKRLPKTQIDFSASYAEVSGSDRFVSGQIDKTTYGASLDLSHELTGKTRLDATLSYDKSDYETGSLFDLEQYKLLVSWQYQYSGKISVGPYVSYEDTEVDTQPDHEALGFGVKFDYQMTGKTAMIGKLGYESRSFSGPMAGSDQNALVYELGLNHDYSGKTNLKMMLYRRSNASYSIASNGYEATGLYFAGTYDMTDRITLKSKMVYEHDAYYSTSTGSAASLDSDYYEFNFGADYDFTDQCTFGVNLIWRSNDSETNSSDFDNMALELFSTYYF